MQPRTDFLYEDKVRFHCHSREQAQALKQCMAMLGTLPADISLRVFRALAKHRGNLEAIGKATQGSKMKVVMHIDKLMAFVNDIANG